jgi:phage gp46-like protein
VKLNESTATARRIGPVKAVDGSLAAVVDFSAPGSALLSVNNGAWAAPTGAIVPILEPDDSPSGLVYYQAELPDAAAQGFISLRLADVCLERVFTEAVEPRPQGIPAGTNDVDLLHVGPLEAKDVDGNPVTGGVGIDVYISINGAKLELPSNAITEILDGVTDRGFYDLALDPTEATAQGWIIVRLSGACQEFVYRQDIVDPANLTGSSSPTAPTLPETSGTGVEPVSGDLALVWSSVTGDADLSVLDVDIDMDLATDRGLMTAVLLSLFTDRRAELDDKPPSGDPTDLRGWWGDQFAATPGDRIGSRLWLLDRSKSTNETALRAKEYVREALAWMLVDRVVSSIDVTVERTSATLLIEIGLQRPGKDPVTFRFSHAWDNLLQESA